MWVSLAVLGLFYGIVLFSVLTAAVVAYADKRGCADAGIAFACFVMLPAFYGGVIWLVTSNQ